MPVSSSLALALLLMAPVGQALAFSVPLCGGCAPRAACGSGASSLRAVGARPSESRLTAEGARSQSAVLDAMLSRRTINEFERALPDGWESALRRAVRAAIFAPNHKRTEPWRFHLLGPEAIRRVCELNAELVAQKKGSEAGEKKLKRWLAMPGWLVVTQVVTSADSGMDEPAGMLREDYAACCCAVQNLCLSLHAEGTALVFVAHGV